MNARGFTLIELMVTLVIAAILLTVGVPALQSLIQRNRLVSQANDFVAALNTARAEAIRRGRDVKITALAPTTSNEWGGGWVIWVDLDGDGIRDANEELRRHGPLGGTSTLDALGGNSDFTFDSRGGAGGTETVNLCWASGEEGREIVLTTAGQVRVSTLNACP